MIQSKRYLGIDFGTKRIGIAVSDIDGRLAFPKAILPNDSNTITKISKMIQENQISDVVIGESVNFSGKPNVLSTKIDAFTEKLKEKSAIPVHKQKEFLTSVEARKGLNAKKRSSSSQAHSRIKKKESVRVDASAAALILQRYLDQNKISKT
jgi:putative holliday junction resolvase